MEGGGSLEPKKRNENGGRDSRGRFTAGNKSGNGRPKKDPEVAGALAAGGLKAANFMVSVLDDPEAKTADKQRAAEYILDRLLGKAAQPIVADVFKADTPLTLDEMFTIAEEVLHEAGGPDAP